MSHLHHFFRHIAVPTGWLMEMQDILRLLIFLPEGPFSTATRVVQECGHSTWGFSWQFAQMFLTPWNGLGTLPSPPLSLIHRCYFHPAPQAFLSWAIFVGLSLPWEQWPIKRSLSDPYTILLSTDMGTFLKHALNYRNRPLTSNRGERLNKRTKSKQAIRDRPEKSKAAKNWVVNQC